MAQGGRAKREREARPLCPVKWLGDGPHGAERQGGDLEEELLG